jgi:hypothetical protein
MILALSLFGNSRQDNPGYLNETLQAPEPYLSRT